MEESGPREFMETLESIWRWAILLAAVFAVGGSLSRLFGAPVRLQMLDRLGLAFVGAMYVGTLLGLIDWLLHVLGAREMGIFYTAVHPVMMLAALALIHLTYVRGRRVESEEARARLFTFGFLGGLAIIVLAIPGVLFRGGLLG